MRSTRHVTAIAFTVGGTNHSMPAVVTGACGSRPQVPSTHGSLEVGRCSSRVSAARAAARWHGGELSSEDCFCSAALRHRAQEHSWLELWALHEQRWPSSGACIAMTRGTPESVSATSAAAKREVGVMWPERSTCGSLLHRRRAPPGGPVGSLRVGFGSSADGSWAAVDRSSRAAYGCPRTAVPSSAGMQRLRVGAVRSCTQKPAIPSCLWMGRPL